MGTGDAGRGEGHKPPLAGIRETVVALASGLTSGLLIVAIFPGKALSTLMHQVLGLPGPGAGTGLVVGPYIMMVTFITFIFRRRRLVPFITASTAGISQALGSIYLGPGVLTAPAALPAIFCSLAAAAAVELVLGIARGLEDRWAFIAAALCGNLMLLGTYWMAVFPAIGRSVIWADAALIASLSAAMAVLLGVLPALMYMRLTMRRAGNG